MTIFHPVVLSVRSKISSDCRKGKWSLLYVSFNCKYKYLQVYLLCILITFVKAWLHFSKCRCKLQLIIDEVWKVLQVCGSKWDWESSWHLLSGYLIVFITWCATCPSRGPSSIIERKYLYIFYTTETKNKITDWQCKLLWNKVFGIN